MFQKCYIFLLEQFRIWITHNLFNVAVGIISAGGLFATFSKSMWKIDPVVIYLFCWILFMLCVILLPLRNIKRKQVKACCDILFYLYEANNKSLLDVKIENEQNIKIHRGDLIYDVDNNLYFVCILEFIEPLDYKMLDINPVKPTTQELHYNVLYNYVDKNGSILNCVITIRGMKNNETSRYKITF